MSATQVLISPKRYATHSQRTILIINILINITIEMACVLSNSASVYDFE